MPGTIPLMARKWPGRRFLQWTLRLTCVLLAIAWAASAGKAIHWVSPNSRFASGIMCGRFGAGWQSAPQAFDDLPGWHVDGGACNVWEWWFDLWIGTTQGRIIIPLWLPFLLVAIPTAVLWLRRGGSEPGHCRKCDYDLTGNISGVCPECGTAIQSGTDPPSEESV